MELEHEVVVCDGLKLAFVPDAPLFVVVGYDKDGTRRLEPTLVESDRVWLQVIRTQWNHGPDTVLAYPAMTLFEGEELVERLSRPPVGRSLQIA